MKKFLLLFLTLASYNTWAANLTGYEIQPTLTKAGLSTQLKVVARYDDNTTVDQTGYTFSSSGINIISGLTAYGSQVGRFSVSAVNGINTIVGSVLVTAGNAARMVYVSGNAQVGTQGSLKTAVVKIVDSFNNPVANYPVGWSTTTGSGNFSVLGSTVNTDENGLASNVYTMGSAPGAETFRAQTSMPVSGLGSYSFTLTVLPGSSAPAKLVFSPAPPTSATQNTTIQSFSVGVRDSLGNSTAVTKTISLTAYKNSACTVLGTGTLTGTMPVETNGASFVSFSDIKYDTAETIYLGAKAAGIPMVCSPYIKVNPQSNGPSKLVFIQQPASGTKGRTLFVSPRVAVQDNLSKTMSSASNNVTIAAYSDASCTTVASPLSGSTSVNAVSGYASFLHVQPTAAGSTYLKATSGSLASGCSSIITIAAGASLTCSSFQHISGNVCVGNTRGCSVSHGGGVQTWNGSDFGVCQAVTCVGGYSVVSNSCTPDPFGVNGVMTLVPNINGNISDAMYDWELNFPAYPVAT